MAVVLAAIAQLTASSDTRRYLGCFNVGAFPKPGTPTWMWTVRKGPHERRTGKDWFEQCRQYCASGNAVPVGCDNNPRWCNSNGGPRKKAYAYFGFECNGYCQCYDENDIPRTGETTATGGDMKYNPENYCLTKWNNDACGSVFESTFDGQRMVWGGSMTSSLYCVGDCPNAVAASYAAPPAVKAPKAAIPKTPYSCREGASTATCYTFYKGCTTCSAGNFNGASYAPWGAAEAQRFCQSWQNNKGKDVTKGIFRESECGKASAIPKAPAVPKASGPKYLGCFNGHQHSPGYAHRKPGGERRNDKNWFGECRSYCAKQTKYANAYFGFECNGYCQCYGASEVPKTAVATTEYDKAFNPEANCLTKWNNDACGTVFESTFDGQRVVWGGSMTSSLYCVSDCPNAVAASYAAPPSAAVVGDPFAVNQNGQKVQFFLRSDEEALLLGCGAVQLYGRAMGTGIAGDHQQWFDRVRFVVGGREELLVNVNKNQTQRQNDAGVNGIDVVAPARHPLKLLNVQVEGKSVEKTGALTTDQSMIAIWQEQAAEKVQISAGSTVVKVESAVAQKFVSADQQKSYTHLDLRFLELKHSECSEGILPEIWGLVPMSEKTAGRLQPPQ